MDEASDTPPPVDTPGPRRLTRSQEGRLITGVCAGLARYTRIDPIVFRVAFGLLVITTGVGILLYIVAFLLMGAPDGSPSRIEKAGKRVFDGDTALALLGAMLGVGVVLGIAGNWGSGDALAVVVVFGLTLLVARSRGVDLVQVARSMPDRIKGRPLAAWTPHAPMPPAYQMSDGMVDLARLGRRTDTYPAGPYGPGPAPAEPRTQPLNPHAHTERPYVPAPPRRRSSYLPALTLLLAIIVGGVLYAAVGDRPHFAGIQIIIAGALVVVACGLVLSAWFGRDHKLVLVGAIMSFALASTSVAGNASVARKTHHMMWRPVASTQAEQPHKVIIGQGVVDLTDVPLSPGQRLQVSAEVTLGVLSVKVPATARVEVDGQAFLGDITVDRQMTSGPRARVRRVLQPESTGATAGLPPATIVLYMRSKVGDMEVTRVPA
jgi:phage shock protein PspC (stress-responsive transcriptional regulator)